MKKKDMKPKEKTETISRWILDGSLPADELIAFAEKQKAPVKATCIEAIEYATRREPSLADENVLAFVTSELAADAPGIKRESARVVGNIAHRYPDRLEQAIAHLLANADHAGTVVRWSAAFALGEILKLKTGHTPALLPAIERICEKEEKNSIRKIYQDAVRKISA